MSHPRLATSICGIDLRNPVIAASGTFAYGLEFDSILSLQALGAFIVKGISLEPMAGNAAPRIYEAEGGMINSIGLQNIGVKAFLRDKVPALRSYQTPYLVNVFAFDVQDFVSVVQHLESEPGPSGYELNVSCPNTKHGGIFFSSDPLLLAEVVTAVRRVATRPIVVKLSPNVARIEPLAKAAEETGADAISLINTFVSLPVNARTRTSRIANGFGGLSGPAIKPIALRLVYEASRAVRIPILGLGGIASGEDAAEFMVAGASAVQVGTASFWDPASTVRIVEELNRFLEEEKIADVRQLVGSLRLH